MASHRKQGLITMPVTLRPEARTAAFMLSAIHRKGEDSPYKQGVKFWVTDVVDAVTCTAFEETFGISVSEFLARVRARVPRSRRRRYVPPDASLERSAVRLLARNKLGATGEDPRSEAR